MKNRICDYADRYARLGLALQWLCGPDCPGSSHGKGHDPKMSGKVPLSGGWSRLGFRPREELLSAHQINANLSILTGWQPSARVSVAVVDLDSKEALVWAVEHLPTTPCRVRTRRGEHWYYRATSSVKPRNFRHTEPRLDMEILGDGRQVVAPPSIHRLPKDGDLNGPRHVYEEIGERPWCAETLAEMPNFDPIWFSEFGRSVPTTSESTNFSQRLIGGSWPGDRTFGLWDFAEARDRVEMYLDAPRTPVSVAGMGGDDTLYAVALAVLRGFPIASRKRVDTLHAEGVTLARVDASDALSEALALIQGIWNPRCLDSDHLTPYPWDEDRIAYKLGQAAQASRLPGPDYWMFDDERQRAKWRQRNGLATTQVQEIVKSDPLVPPMESGVPTEEYDPRNPRMPARAVEWTLAWVADSARFRGLEDVRGKWTPRTPQRQFDSDLPRIELTGNLAKMVEQASAALARENNVFVHKQKICDLVEESGKDRHGFRVRPYLRETTKNYMMVLLSRCAKWGKSAEEDDQRTSRPDKDVAAGVLALGRWPEIRVLDAIVYTPVVLPNGEILQEEGWCEGPPNLLYVNEMQLDRPIHGAPSRTDCAKALALLLDVIEDFPFAKPEDAKAVWLSAVLTRFAQHAFTGKIPMFVAAANTKEAGKGLLVNTAALITDGRPADMMSFTGDNSEDNRVILAHGMQETPTVCVDNIDRGKPLAGGAFESMLTAPAFGARVVGTSKFARIAFATTIWWATGHGLETGGDMARRILRIDIDDRTPNPGQRAVQHPDLERYVQDHRPLLVRAALTLLSGWYAAGRPKAKIPKFSNFNEWSAVVRQCVVWCGLPDPHNSVGKVEDDATDSGREMLLRLLRPFGKFRPGEVVNILIGDTKRPGGPQHADLADFLSDSQVDYLASGRAGAINFGKHLVKHSGHTVAIDGQNYQLNRVKEACAAGKRWHVEQVSK